MKKLFGLLVALFLVCSFCFGQVNMGIQTRTKFVSFVIDSGVTDTTEAIIDLSQSAEQGWPTLIIGSDSMKSFNAWFSSGTSIRWWGTKTTWTDRVQCMWTEEIAEEDFTKPINIAFLQSLELVDNTDRSLGHVPGCDLFRVSIEPTTETGGVIDCIAILKFK